MLKILSLHRSCQCIMDDLEKKILEDIQKTGFVSELNAVSILIENDWKTDHSETYEDKDENKSREIDIIASKSIYVHDIGFRFSFYIFIEVKKTDRPWIIFTTDRKFASTGWRIMHRSYNDRKSGEISSIFDIGCINPNDPRENRFRVGKAFHELNKQPSDKSKIYEALITSCKAAKYFSDLYERPFSHFDPEKETELSIYLPIVILDGLLFEVFNGINGQILVHRREHIPIEMSYSSPNYRLGRWDSDFLPDIITLNYLQEHLRVLETWRKSILAEAIVRLKNNGKKPFHKA